MQLQDVLYGVAITNLVGSTNREISALTFDSRKVGQDAVFFAITGTVADGHKFISQTIAAGATVIICEEIPEERAAGVTYIEVADSSVALGRMAANFYGNPSTKLN
jgi:UDP-N-acetylmuramoyl-L-alanyl-D-glutamate--2,6-diaminopimelate ligase